MFLCSDQLNFTSIMLGLPLCYFSLQRTNFQTPSCVLFPLALLHPPKFRPRTRRRDLLLEPLLPAPSLYAGSQAHDSSKIWNSLVMAGLHRSLHHWFFLAIFCDDLNFFCWLCTISFLSFTISFPQGCGLHMRLRRSRVTCQFFPCMCALMIREWFALQAVNIISRNIFIKIRSNWNGVRCWGGIIVGVKFL